MDRDVEFDHTGAGQRLPTMRILAERLEVTVGTVYRAYALAETQGLVVRQMGRGTFVRGRAADEAGEAAEAISTEGTVDLSRNEPVEIPLEEAAEDYLYSLEKLVFAADYITINVSSPNTPGLRALQAKQPNFDYSTEDGLFILLKANEVHVTPPILARLDGNHDGSVTVTEAKAKTGNNMAVAVRRIDRPRSSVELGRPIGWGRWIDVILLAGWSPRQHRPRPPG